VIKTNALYTQLMLVHMVGGTHYCTYGRTKHITLYISIM